MTIYVTVENLLKKGYIMSIKSLGSFTTDINLNSDGTYDAYITHDGNSGEHYEHVSADEVGKIVADLIECIADSY
jgi:hypothetical protein